MTALKKYELLLPKNIKRELANEHNSTRQEIRRAFRFLNNSPRAKLLRAAAYERGAQLYTGENIDKSNRK